MICDYLWAVVRVCCAVGAVPCQGSWGRAAECHSGLCAAWVGFEQRCWEPLLANHREGLMSMSWWGKAVCGEAVERLRPGAQSSSVPGQGTHVGTEGADRSLDRLCSLHVSTWTLCAVLQMGRHRNGVYVPLRKIPQDNQYPNDWLVIILPRTPPHPWDPWQWREGSYISSIVALLKIQ